MMKKVVCLACAAYLFTFPIHSEASTLGNSFSFKCMVMTNGVEHEWEFSSPNEYEFETGKTVEKGAAAKRKVSALFQHLNVTELAQVDELVEKMGTYGYQDVERFEIKWMDSNGRLYTWVWNEGDK